ncbi:hypothetical protein IEQ34_011723 [Dendrobium chrysotoxum]|uniref:Uncharacterized protein n=1 Tax=Dendrobium chrysotoxum TaxID=161865 RepID=A0AAV7GAS2_DENCH|nr:hypothetical protein IEQ34_011723 [Dendrobium chrysotoxum]
MSLRQQRSEAPMLLLSSPQPQPSFFTSSVPPLEREFMRSEEGWSFSNSHDDHLQVSDGSMESRDLETNQAKLCTRGHWRPTEDTKLKELVAQFGPQNWNLIAENLEGRSGKSCRLRWFNQLDPRINRKAFTPEEEERLLSVQHHYGNKWSLIARFFPGRTDNAVKNQWHVIMARKQREHSISYRRRRFTSSTSFNPSIHLKTLEHNTSSAESTITSTREESVSTATTRTVHGLVLTPQQKKAKFFIMGISRSVINECYGNLEDLFCASVEGGKSSGDQIALSDSTSKASASESMVIKGAELERGRINLPFFDFLGIGAAEEKPLMVIRMGSEKEGYQQKKCFDGDFSPAYV